MEMSSKDTDELDVWIYSFRMGKDREMDDGMMNVWMMDWKSDGKVYVKVDGAFHQIASITVIE